MQSDAGVLYDLSVQYPKSRLGKAILVRYATLPPREKTAFDLERSGLTLKEIGKGTPGAYGAPSISTERARQLLCAVNRRMRVAACAALNGREAALDYMLRSLRAAPVFDLFVGLTEKEEELPVPALTQKDILLDKMEVSDAKFAQYGIDCPRSPHECG